MIQALYLPALVALTSLLVYAVARRRHRLDPAGLRRALGRVLEWAGLAVALYALNLAVGFVAVLLIRNATGAFMSLYVNTDATLAILSVLQAIAFQWWRAEGE